MGRHGLYSIKEIVFTLLIVNGLIIISSLSVIKFSDVSAAETKKGNSTATATIVATTTARHDPPSPDDSGTLLVVESVRFANGSFPTVPPVEIGTVTVSGNNPTPTHFKFAAGDNEEGTEVQIGPGKYSVTFSLPSNYKLVGTEFNCTGVMVIGGSDQCTLDVQQQTGLPTSR